MECFFQKIIPNKTEGHFNEKTVGISVPCGKCLACLERKRNTWSYRLEYELKSHYFATFVTLTYSDENLPKDLSVSRRELQLFIKLLRFHLKKPIRYYAIGEYGTKYGRPHYHLIIYGLHHILDAKLVQDVWKKGHTLCIDANPKTINYITKYHIIGKNAKEGLTPPFL